MTGTLVTRRYGSHDCLDLVQRRSHLFAANDNRSKYASCVGDSTPLLRNAATSQA